MLGGVEGGDQRRHLVDAVEKPRLGREPHALGLERRRRQIERRGVDDAAVRDGLALESDNLFGHLDPAEEEPDSRNHPAL